MGAQRLYSAVGSGRSADLDNVYFFPVPMLQERPDEQKDFRHSRFGVVLYDTRRYKRLLQLRSFLFELCNTVFALQRNHKHKEREDKTAYREKQEVILYGAKELKGLCG